MADVLLARSDGLEGFERHVVIKRIRPDLARDRRFIRMFLDEARVAATLHHQNIVQVHDVGEAGGEYFIAMEYVHGEDTRKLLSTAARSRNHVPLGYATAIVSAAAAGLHHAHERLGNDRQPLNIVHRDVSPSNILISYDGGIKLVDFGIATASMRPETRSGSLKGKLSYMSPEQCSGAPVDRRTDVYALGVVLYELATTTRMIKGDTDYVVMEQIVHGKIAPPQSRRAELPDKLVDIIMRALATDRDRRYASAEELRIALDQFAWNAGLTTPASSMAAYMRQQFGQRPEPWLELSDEAGIEFADIPESPGSRVMRRTRGFTGSGTGSGSGAGVGGGSIVGSGGGSRPGDELGSGVNWTERASSQSKPPPQTGSLPGRLSALDAQIAGAEPSAASRPPAPSQTAPRTGWDDLPRPPAESRFPVWIAAGVGLMAITGIAVWLVATMGGGPKVAAVPPPVAPVVAVATVDAAAAPGVATPAVVAAAETVEPPMAIPEDAGTRPDAGTARRPVRATASREPDPPVRRPERAARVAVATPAPAVETPPARGRPDRISTGGSAEPAGSDAGDNDSHRPTAPAPVAPPPTPAPAPAPSVATPPPAVAAAPAATAPQVITPAALEANRIAGEKVILPDSITQDAINRAGAESVVSTFKVCVGADGNISMIAPMKGSGFAAYDEKIRSTVRATWRYRPFIASGRPTPVCTALRFVYAQR
jgi:serine/threonine protein kinase